MKTKKQKVLEYIQVNPKKGISSLEAIKMFNATRLSGIIYDLKKEGYEIESVPELYKALDGSVSNYARYFYKGRKF